MRFLFMATFQPVLHFVSECSYFVVTSGKTERMGSKKS